MTTNKKKTEIKTEAEAESAMLALAEVESELVSYVTAEALAVQKARQKFYQGDLAVRKAGLEYSAEEIAKNLKAYAKSAVKGWEGKSRETPGGTFGFRWGKPAVALVKSIAKTFDEALINVKLNCQQFNRRVDTLNKELIIQAHNEEVLDVDRLYLCGLKVEQKERFFVTSTAATALGKAREKLKKA